MRLEKLGSVKTYQLNLRVRHQKINKIVKKKFFKAFMTRSDPKFSF